LNSLSSSTFDHHILPFLHFQFFWLSRHELSSRK
jgi:hypothetical protein